MMVVSVSDFHEAYTEHIEKIKRGEAKTPFQLMEDMQESINNGYVNWKYAFKETVKAMAKSKMGRGK